MVNSSSTCRFRKAWRSPDDLYKGDSAKHTPNSRLAVLFSAASSDAPTLARQTHFSTRPATNKKNMGVDIRESLAKVVTKQLTGWQDQWPTSCNSSSP